jgi:glycosyltransferase involved in cell wall biosynthesis
MLDQITPIIITYNEAPNIRRCLEKLRWATKVLVVDSFSTDETLDHCREFENTSIVQHKFSGFAEQCNFAIRNPEICTDWVLSLDADYILANALIEELSRLEPPDNVAGYQTRFTYCIDGIPIRGSLYPPVTTLFRKNIACYRQDGHAHRVVLDGDVLSLATGMYHDDRKTRTRWIQSQKRYCRQEAIKLRKTPFRRLTPADKIRRIPGLSLLLLMPYLILIKGLIFSGRPGWKYMMQRLYAEALLQHALLTHKGPEAPPPHG